MTFPDLTVAERALWDAFADGSHVDLAGPDPTAPGVRASEFSHESVIRAEVIAALLLGGAPTRPGRTARVHLDGARIVGVLNLMDGQVDVALGIGRCWFEEGIDLGDARTRGIWLHQCRIPIVGAVGATIEGPLIVENCLVKRVEVESVHITGSLNLTGTTLLPCKGSGVNAINAIIGQDLIGPSASDGGSVLLAGATVGGTLHLDQGVTSQTCLVGLRYEGLRPDAPVDERLRLLRSDPHGYHPQPYEHLANHYQRLGHDRDASTVRLAQLRARRRNAPLWRRLGGATLDLIAGYGYAPGRALLILAVAAIGGTAYFLLNPPTAIGRSAQFDPTTAVLYTIDALVPTSPLGQQQQWQPASTTAINVLTLLHIVGWMLSIAIVPAVTRALGKRR